MFRLKKIAAADKHEEALHLQFCTIRACCNQRNDRVSHVTFILSNLKYKLLWLGSKSHLFDFDHVCGKNTVILMSTSRASDYFP